MKIDKDTLSQVLYVQIKQVKEFWSLARYFNLITSA